MLIFLSMLESDNDKRLFMELYEEYYYPIMHMAQRLFPNSPSDAEDASQSAWMKVAENFSKILKISCKNRGAYLVTIVKNEAITMLRQKQPDLSLDEAILKDKVETPDNYRDTIVEIIRNMSLTYRDIMEMRFLDELSTKQISTMLNMSESAVNTRIHRGRAILISKLRKEGYES